MTTKSEIPDFILDRLDRFANETEQLLSFLQIHGRTRGAYEYKSFRSGKLASLAVFVREVFTKSPDRATTVEVKAYLKLAVLAARGRVSRLRTADEILHLTTF